MEKYTVLVINILANNGLPDHCPIVARYDPVVARFCLPVFETLVRGSAH